ncbi:unnamed protein product [Chrysodeixis includens]|uniref:Uncharacterized protein n=1 Tax=Chrysodeixis includens TaxID=689277 RepID=A0A9N8PZT4_CHRIL|nr:unnamed protein product [Chrysodeixis includens]
MKALVCQRYGDLLGFSPLLVRLELVVVALSVDRSLEARAERSRGSTGTSSASGEVAGSHAQPSARAADHTANTNVNIVGYRATRRPLLLPAPRLRSRENDNSGMVALGVHVQRRAAVLVRASHARAARTTLGSAPSRWHALYTMHSCYRHY